MHTTKELQLMNDLNSPLKVQKYLDELTYDMCAYNGNYRVRSFRSTVADKQALCLDGALTGAHFLEEQGQEPILIVTRASPFGHALALYSNGKVGGVGKSKYDSLKKLECVFGNESELARELEDRFRSVGSEVYGSGIVELNRLKSVNWRFSLEDLNLLGINQKIYALMKPI